MDNSSESSNMSMCGIFSRLNNYLTFHANFETLIATIIFSVQYISSTFPARRVLHLSHFLLVAMIWTNYHDLIGHFLVYKFKCPI